jgi:hypothetical protein
METKQTYIDANLRLATKVILEDGESSLPDAEVISKAERLLTFLYEEKVNNRMIELAKELIELLDQKLETIDD